MWELTRLKSINVTSPNTTLMIDKQNDILKKKLRQCQIG